MSTPPIYLWRCRPARLPVLGRLLALGAGMACLAVLVIAARIRPSENGIGSHTELGLQPCSLYRRTGVPCLTCGMTTSYAHFVRGRLASGFMAQPAGLVAAMGTALAFWACLYVAVTGRPAHRLLRLVPTRYYLVPLSILALAAWAWKIWFEVWGTAGGA